jgi:hypothetical protein
VPGEAVLLVLSLMGTVVVWQQFAGFEEAPMSGKLLCRGETPVSENFKVSISDSGRRSEIVRVDGLRLGKEARLA